MTKKSSKQAASPAKNTAVKVSDSKKPQTGARAVMSKILSFIGSKKFAYILIAWFVLQAGFIAFTTENGIAPDEGFHVRTIKVYVENGLSPFIESSRTDGQLRGTTARSPQYVFHYVLSFPYRVLPDSWSNDSKLIALRLLNVAFVTAGLIVFMRVLERLTKRGIVRNMTLAMLTNTLMFVFLAGSVNYDNLFFLAVSIVLYYFVKLYQKFSLLDVLKLGSAMVFALLVKFTFVPLAVILALVLLARYAFRLKSVWADSKIEVKKFKKPLLIFGVIFMLFLGLFVERYVMNFVQYGSYRPKCEKVLTVETCLQNALYRRNAEFKNPVDDPIPNPGFVVQWAIKTKQGVYGILVHKIMHEPLLMRFGVAVVFLTMGVAFIRTVRRKEDALVLMIMLIIAFYIGTLIVHNHNLYERSGILGMGLQGRYLFPVLGLIYFAGNYFVDKLLRKKEIAYAAYIGFALLLFFMSSLPSYINGIDESWRMPAMNTVNIQIKKVIDPVLP